MAKIKNAIPNLFTFTNLCCGILSLIMSFQGNYTIAALVIFLAGIADRYDGKVARLLNVSSEIGKELDSLADLISFGLAPSLLIFNIYDFTQLGVFGYLVVLIFPLAGAYRLARYNISDFDGVYSGVPITICGTFLALYALLIMHNPVNVTETAILLLILSYLMVCNLRLKKR